MGKTYFEKTDEVLKMDAETFSDLLEKETCNYGFAADFVNNYVGNVHDKRNNLNRATTVREAINHLFLAYGDNISYATAKAISLGLSIPQDYFEKCKDVSNEMLAITFNTNAETIECNRVLSSKINEVSVKTRRR